MTYKFVVRKERNNAVMLRLTANRKSSELSLGVSVAPETLEEILHGETPKGYKEQSMVIRHYQYVLEDLIEQLKDEGVKIFSASEFQQRIRKEIEGRKSPKTSESKRSDIYPVFEEKIGTLRNLNTQETYTKALGYIKCFCADEENPLRKDQEALMFADITPKWLTAFDNWMAEKRNLKTNSRWLYLLKLRAIVNKALDDEIIEKDPFRRFKIQREKTRKRSLSVDDLRLLFNYQGTKIQQYYIDMFKLIFMLCGINTKDLYNLKSITRNGRIEYRRAKTGRLYSIKVEPEAMALINKYKGTDYLLIIAEKTPAFRSYTSLFNGMLKRIGKKIDAQLVADKKKSDKEESDLSQISPYWARHTWATIARKLKVPIDDIALALGHSTGHDTTDIYIAEDHEAIDIANRRVLDYVLYGKS